MMADHDPDSVLALALCLLTTTTICSLYWFSNFHDYARNNVTSAKRLARIEGSVYQQLAYRTAPPLGLGKKVAVYECVSIATPLYKRNR